LSGKGLLHRPIAPIVVEREPPAKRVSSCDGKLERHLPEAGVMLAVARWLFGNGATRVDIHADGMHAKHFDIGGWLEAEGFEKIADGGRTRGAGVYRRAEATLGIDFRSGLGDVVAQVQGARVLVEAKGGCINSRNPGQLSKLRRHLYEAVGSLLDGREADRLIAAVPLHAQTERIAGRMAPRCRAAGIEIALVAADGGVQVRA